MMMMMMMIMLIMMMITIIIIIIITVTEQFGQGVTLQICIGRSKSRARNQLS
jgi:hypothetical protein